MAWFLDTNIFVACLRGKSSSAMLRLCAIPAADVGIPLQVHAELLFGAAKSRDPAKAQARVEAFLAPFHVVWPDATVEQHYISIRAHLEAAGIPIGEADLWIAATARATGNTLVTNNTGEFSRVPGLTIADWTQP